MRFGDPVVRRAALIATAATLPIVVIALVLLGSNQGSGSKSNNSGSAVLSPVSVPAPPANPAADAPCTALLGTLPVSIVTSNGTLAGRPAQSTWTYVAAWGDPAIVLRCGVPRPAALVPDSSALLIPVNGVTFLPANGKRDNVFTVVDRAVYIEVTVPSSYQQPPLGPIADAISKAMKPVCLPQAGQGQTAVPSADLCARRP